MEQLTHTHMLDCWRFPDHTTVSLPPFVPVKDPAPVQGRVMAHTGCWCFCKEGAVPGQGHLKELHGPSSTSPYSLSVLGLGM